MKIGLITFIESENYGAALQAIGLQKTLKKLGYQSYYINYAEGTYVTGVKKIINKIWGIVKLFLGSFTRRKKTNKYTNKHLTLTSKCETLDDVRKLPLFDTYIVGSDQVWNPRFFIASEGFYLLSFLETYTPNTKIISYATSFGINSLPDENKEVYKHHLTKFESLSVREQEGKTILKELGFDSQVNLDPTLLINKESWSNFFEKERLKKEKYIFCYVANGDSTGAKEVYKVSKRIQKESKEKLNIYIVGDKEYKIFKPGYNLITTADPSDFMNLIYHAEYVVTNTFHGTCFSINFEKQFTTILHTNNSLNNRTENILSILNLSDRIQYINQVASNIILENIDYNETTPLLDKLRKESENYLVRSLK